MPPCEEVQQQTQPDTCGPQEQILKRAESFRRQLAIQQEAHDRWFAEMKELSDAIKVQLERRSNQAGNSSNHGGNMSSLSQIDLPVCEVGKVTMRHGSGVGNPPSGDALQVFEGSPEVISDLCVQEGVSVGGQLEVSENADLKPSFRDVNSEMSGNEELLVPVKNLKAFAIGLKAVFGKQSVSSDSDDGVMKVLLGHRMILMGITLRKLTKNFLGLMMLMTCHGYGGGIISSPEYSSASDRPLVSKALSKIDLTDVLPKVARRFDDVRQSGQFMAPDSCCQPFVSSHSFNIQGTPIHRCKYYDVALEKVISFPDLELHKVANGFCVFAFDPGILGAGQRTPQPRTFAFLCAWPIEILAVFKPLVLRLVFYPGSCFVIPGSPTEAWEADSLMVFNEEKLRAKIALVGSNDFVVTVVGSEFMYKDLWVEHALVLQALRPLLEKSPSENTSSSGLRIFILTGDSTSNYTKAVAYSAAVQAAVWSGRGNEKVQVDIDAFWNSSEQSYTMLLLQLMSSRAVADEVLYWLCGTAQESEGYIWQCAPPFKSLELKQSCEQMMKETVKSLHMGGYRAFTILSSQDVQSLLKWQPAVAVPSIDLNEFYALNGPEVTMPRDGLQPWGIFDPGGMIILFTGLLLYTIHNLDAEGAVFDPGKTVVLRMTIVASSWSEAGKKVLMGGWSSTSPVVVQAQGAVTDMDVLGMLAVEPGPLSKEVGKEGLLGSCILTWKQGYLGAAYRHGSKVSFLQLGSLRTSFCKGEGLIRANGEVTWLARRKEGAKWEEVVEVGSSLLVGAVRVIFSFPVAS